MADTRIFLTRDDFLQLSEFMFVQFSATLIPTINHDEAKEIKLKTTEDIKIHLDKFTKRKSGGLSYFVVSPHWTIEPIYFHRVESTTGLGTFYAAHNRYGGPYIELIPCFGFPKETDGKIIGGLISNYPYYISGSFLTNKVNGYKTIDRPSPIATAMKEIKTFIKRSGGQVTSKSTVTRTAYAMQGAFGQLEKGLYLMEGDLRYVKKK